MPENWKRNIFETFKLSDPYASDSSISDISPSPLSTPSQTSSFDDMARGASKQIRSGKSLTKGDYLAKHCNQRGLNRLFSRSLDDGPEMATTSTLVKPKVAEKELTPSTMMVI